MRQRSLCPPNYSPKPINDPLVRRPFLRHATQRNRLPTSNSNMGPVYGAVEWIRKRVPFGPLSSRVSPRHWVVTPVTERGGNSGAPSHQSRHRAFPVVGEWQLPPNEVGGSCVSPFLSNYTRVERKNSHKLGERLWKSPAHKTENRE